jgi:hypothetical protein
MQKLHQTRSQPTGETRPSDDVPRIAMNRIGTGGLANGRRVDSGVETTKVPRWVCGRIGLPRMDSGPIILHGASDLRASSLTSGNPVFMKPFVQCENLHLGCDQKASPEEITLKEVPPPSDVLILPTDPLNQAWILCAPDHQHHHSTVGTVPKVIRTAFPTRNLRDIPPFPSVRRASGTAP